MTTSPNPRFGLLCTETRILHSECVGEEYRIGIWTPYSYPSSERSYPVLYIPDGDFAFSIAHGLIPPMLNLQEIPEIETHYRADRTNRALYGFSSSGFFTMQMLLTRPGLFRRYIAASCTWPGADQVMLDFEEQYARQPNHPPADLFLAVGGLEDDQLSGFHALGVALRQRNYPDHV